MKIYDASVQVQGRKHVTLASALEAMDVSGYIAVVRAFRPLPRGRWEEVNVWFNPNPYFYPRRPGAHFDASLHESGTGRRLWGEGSVYPLQDDDADASRRTHANMKRALRAMNVRIRVPGS